MLEVGFFRVTEGVKAPVTTRRLRGIYMQRVAQGRPEAS